MASICPKRNGFEIRECLRTEKGPRQFTLARFRGVLSPEVLDRAEEKARKPFARQQVIARALELGIAVTHRRSFPEARALLAALARGGRVEPSLVGLLKEALEPLASQPLPHHLEEAAPWLGQPERERGKALRGLLRTADRIVQSRGPLRTRPGQEFPRFRTQPSESG